MYNRDKIIQTMYEIKNESEQIGPYVVIAQPRRIKEETPAQNFDGHIGLHVDLHGFSHGFIDIFGEKVDVARNYLMERAIESGAKYLFFIGEDTVVPYDAFKILHRTAEENPGAIVAGVYYIKLSDAMIMVRNGNWITVPNVDPGQIIEAWQTGMDCMLIPIDTLKKMKEQDSDLPFCCIANNIGDIPFIGEDNFFVHRIHKMGTKLLVNTDVQCLHMDLASGKYTAHPSVDLRKYYTNIPITEPLVMEDKEYIDNRWLNRLPKGSNNTNSNSKITQAIESGNPVKFNMGSGRDRLDGYIAVDLHNPAADINEDVLKLAIPENTVDEIYSSHLIEHLNPTEVIPLLGRWYSALKQNGKLIIETPDLEAMCNDFANASDEERYIITMCIFGAAANNITTESLANGTASPHLWGFYPKVLIDILTQIGFTNVEILPQQGLHPGKNFRIEAVKNTK